MAGDEQYLPARDKGPVKAYVRDIIDARRNLVGLFMPVALVMIATMFLGPQLASVVTLAMLVVFAVMIIEGLLIGRIVNKRVSERFPEHSERPLSLGWYAFVRASQMRRMRMPKPRVSAGDAV